MRGSGGSQAWRSRPRAGLTGTDLFANTKSGRNRAPRSGPAHGLDDHRSRHEAEYERRFAKAVADEAAELVEAHGIERLIVVAPPSLLGQLRPPLRARLPDGLRVEEMPRDVSWHAQAELEELLERRGLIAQGGCPRRHIDRRVSLHHTDSGHSARLHERY